MTGSFYRFLFWGPFCVLVLPLLFIFAYLSLFLCRSGDTYTETYTIGGVDVEKNGWRENGYDVFVDKVGNKYFSDNGQDYYKG